MSTVNEWRGDAPATEHRARVAINAATPGALYQLVLANVATLDTRGAADDTPATIAERLAGLVANLPDVSITRTAGSHEFEVAGTILGEPFADDISGNNPAASYTEHIRPGVLPTKQEFLVTLPATTDGGTWTLTANFGGDDETTANIDHDDDPDTVATRLNALTTPAASDFSVSLEQTEPRTYRVKVGGTLAGTAIALSADHSSLTGNATVTPTRTQSTGGQAPAVWAIRAKIPDEGTNSFVVSVGDDDYTGITLANLASETWWNSVLPVDAVNFTSLTYSDNMDGGDYIMSAFALSHADLITVDPATAGFGYAGEATRVQEYLGTSNNEFQFIDRMSSGQPQTRTITFDGQTSGAHTTNDNIDATLETLSNIGAGDVEATVGYLATQYPGYGLSVEDAPALVEFKNSLAAADQPLMYTTYGGTDHDAILISDGAGPANVVDKIEITADGGTFTIAADGNAASGNINHGSDAATVDTAIEATLPAGETVDVSGDGKPGTGYDIEYTGDLAGVEVAAIVVDGSNLTGGKKISVSQTKAAVAGVNAQQMIYIDPNNSDGTYNLGFDGELTDDIDHDETVANALVEFLALSTVGAGNATFAGTKTQILVEFQNDLGQQPVPLITIDQDELVVTGESSMTVETISRASGPTFWNNAANWTLGHVPNTSESVKLGSGRNDIARGLVQACECTFTGTDIVCGKLADFVDGQQIRLRTTDTLPTAQDSGGAVVLSESTTYHIVAIDYRDGVQVLKISETANGEPIEYTDAGTGTHRVSVQLTALRQYAAYTGKVGHHQRDNSGEWFDGERYLQIDFLDPTANEPNLEIGIGKGAGSGQFYLDAGPAHIDGRIIRTASPVSGAAFNLLNDNLAESELLCIAGNTAIAIEEGESAALARILSFENALLTLGNVDYTRLESYGEQVAFANSTATGTTVQMRTR